MWKGKHVLALRHKTTFWTNNSIGWQKEILQHVSILHQKIAVPFNFFFRLKSSSYLDFFLHFFAIRERDSAALQKLKFCKKKSSSTEWKNKETSDISVFVLLHVPRHRQGPVTRIPKQSQPAEPCPMATWNLLDFYLSPQARGTPANRLTLP
jgi:hypothetical protein